MAAVNPFLPRIPVNMREKYLFESLKELQSLKSPSQDGCTVATYRLMVAYIRRPAQ